jgi:hypothetical protein
VSLAARTALSSVMVVMGSSPGNAYEKTSNARRSQNGPVRAIAGIKGKQRTAAASGSFAVNHREAARLASAVGLFRSMSCCGTPRRAFPTELRTSFYTA